MNVEYTSTARRHIAAQIGFLIDRGAVRAARRLRSRIDNFIQGFVARHPRASRYIPQDEVYETWIPRTPYVLIYKFEPTRDTVTILALFHTSQDRR